MPVNRSCLEMKHILCQVKIGRRLSLALNDLSMKTGRRPRVRNSEFAASRPSYRTGLGSDISRKAVKYLLPRRCQLDVGLPGLRVLGNHIRNNVHSHSILSFLEFTQVENLKEAATSIGWGNP
jgi:hypothetical protein